MKHTVKNYMSFWTREDIESLSLNKTQIQIEQFLKSPSNQYDKISDVFVQHIYNWVNKNGIGRQFFRADDQEDMVYKKNTDINSDSPRMQEVGISQEFLFSPESQDNLFVDIDKKEVYSTILTSTVEYQESEDNWILELLKEEAETVISTDSIKDGLLESFKRLCQNRLLPRFVVLDCESYIELFIETGAEYLGVDNLRKVFEDKKYGNFEGVEIVVSCFTQTSTILMLASPDCVGACISPLVKCTYNHDEDDNTKGWQIESNTKVCVINNQAIIKVERT
jgi:hypothetical protein